MARKTCTDCGTRPTTSESPEGLLCAPCLSYAENENDHGDNGHDALLGNDDRPMLADGWMFSDQDQLDAYVADTRRIMAECPVCHPELDPRNVAPRTGHHNTAAHSWNSHAGHGHPTTAAARAACRKANGGTTPAV